MGDRTARWSPFRATILLAIVASAALGRAEAGAPPAIAAVSAPAASVPSDAESVPGQALVRFRPDTPAAVRSALHARAGVRVARRVAGGYDLVAFDDGVPLSGVLAAYRNTPSVAVAEPNHLARIALTPGDPCASGCSGVSQYGLGLVNAANGWGVFPGRTYDAAAKRALSPVTVAVLDTKIDRTNPDFANVGSASTDDADGGQLDLAGARDWVPASKQTGSAAYHGTYVAGIAAAATGNGRDVAAIGFAARVLPLTVVDGNGLADAAALADAIVYAWQRGARVINLSLGLVADSQAVRDAIVRVTAGSAPSLVVAAAGNNTGSAPFYPGSYPQVMSVSGTGSADNRASCSNYNANVSVSAPAEKVLSLAPMPSELAAAACGTSAATPHVSGLAALLFAQDPARTPAQVRKIIESSADDLGAAGRDQYFGFGRINVERALRYGDGSPVTSLARATVPPASGGPSTVTALAASSRGVRAAEIRFGSPTAPPVAMTAADGAWGGAAEALRGTITIPAGTPVGPHPFYVRAYDGTAWGASTTGVIIVDRTAPSLTNVAASNGVRATAQPVSVTFTTWDAVSPVVAYAVQIFSAPDHRLVFQDVRQWVGTGSLRYDWRPSGEVLPGRYDIKLIVADQAGNQTQTLTNAVLA